MSQYYSVIIDLSISGPGNGKEVGGGLNSIDKLYIYQLMSNVKIMESKTFDSQIIMCSCTQNNDASLDNEFQNHLSKEHWKHGDLDQEK